MTDKPADNIPAPQTEPIAPIANVQDFSRGMLEAARDMYQNKELRREVAKRIS